MPRSKKTNTAVGTLATDYIRLKKDPVPNITAEPLPSNMLEWHYVINGSESTPFQGGYYHGRIVFPEEFPFKPPSIYMITPNGRFSTTNKLCLSMSDAHPETWNPVWSISTILLGLQSFMSEKREKRRGNRDVPEKTIKALAYYSLQFNLQNKLFCELFPEIVVEIKEKLSRRKNKNQHVEASASAELLE